MTDPITLEVVRNRLEAIADEMESVILRSSHSAIVKEALDASAALFDARGQQIAQAAAAPIHLGSMIPGIEQLVAKHPPATMQPGDVFVLNDPYEGGTHLPDVLMAVPVFAGGRIVGLAAVITHHQDVGGSRPGSTPANATEIFQEGLRIPLLKLYDAGVPNETLLAIIQRNVRIPDVVMGDLNGQLAACEIGRRGLATLVERFGTDAFAELLDRAERLTREALARIPDGTYRFVDYLDDDGIRVGRQIRIEVAVTIAGDELEIDLTGSDDQATGPINCVRASTLAAIYYTVKVVTDPEIPANAGCYRPVRLVLPERSVVNASPPAPVNGRAVTVRRVVDALLGAFAQAIPDRIPAASSGHPLVMSMGGVDPASGRAYVTAEVGTGGMGARPGKDGIEAIQTDTSNAQNVPVEALELEYPLRVGYYRLRPDSGGRGRWRGGLGTEKSLEVLRGELRVSHRGERRLSSPWGLQGGEDGARARTLLHRADGSEQELPSKLDFTMQPGDLLELWTSGGGGFGPPGERDPAAQAEDIAGGKVTR